MANQFTFYNSFDPFAPPLNGLTGSLVSLLDACLINGYGTKPGAGWTRPIPTTSSVAAYQQGTGSRLMLVVNDATGSGQEAWIAGYESVTAVTQPIGTGSGQFPLPIQSLSTGRLVFRKSTAASAVTRQWFMFADSSSFYLFCHSGDLSATQKYGMFFGDIYSYSKPVDTKKCMIIGSTVDQTAGSGTGHQFDWFSYYIGAIPPASTAVSGHYMSRKNNSSVPWQIGKVGDIARASSGNSAFSMIGLVPFPNTSDGKMYISPIWVNEPNSATIIGKMRGFWHVCHPLANVFDGQIFYGTGNLDGRIFRAFRSGGSGGVYAFEISPTVDTN